MSDKVSTLSNSLHQHPFHLHRARLADRCQAGRQTKKMDRQTDKTDKKTDRPGRQEDRQADRQEDGQTVRQAIRKTDRLSVADNSPTAPCTLPISTELWMGVRLSPAWCITREPETGKHNALHTV